MYVSNYLDDQNLIHILYTVDDIAKKNIYM